MRATFEDRSVPCPINFLRIEELHIPQTAAPREGEPISLVLTGVLLLNFSRTVTRDGRPASVSRAGPWHAANSLSRALSSSALLSRVLATHPISLSLVAISISPSDLRLASFIGISGRGETKKS